MDTLTPLQPSLCLLPFDLWELVEGVRAEHFADLAGPVPIFITETRPLACVVPGMHEDKRSRGIYLHPILNDPGTPPEVLVAIAKHELIHFVVPARRVFGRVTAHPPEFWDHEQDLAPEMDRVWAWVYACLGPCLLDRRGSDRVHVRRTWRRIRLEPRLTWNSIEPRSAANGDGDDMWWPGRQDYSSYTSRRWPTRSTLTMRKSSSMS